MSLLRDRTMWIKQAGLGKLWHYPERFTRTGEVVGLTTHCGQYWTQGQVSEEGIPQDGAGICRECEREVLQADLLIQK